jgi:hypothetical protein
VISPDAIFKIPLKPPLLLFDFVVQREPVRSRHIVRALNDRHLNSHRPPSRVLD